jgi:hypothetical protein
MKNIFNTVLAKKPKKNVFDLSHDIKFTSKMGELTPCAVIECVPGDKFNIAGDALIRFAPLTAPIMHRVNVTIHYFFVPNRIVWDNWETFITGDNLGVGAPTPAAPYIQTDYDLPDEYKRFLDYMGVPPAPVPVTQPPYPIEEVNALPFAAYQMIYNEYYRDQNLVTEINFKLNDGYNGNYQDLLTLRKRAYEHDYFTACLPFAQKGAAVQIPLGTVQLDPDWFNKQNYPEVRQPDGSYVTGDYLTTIGGELVSASNGAPPTYEQAAYDPNGSLQVGATQINDLRRAFRLQEWLEKNARGGTRYAEHILQHFGVKARDSRLQRPEYITGTRAPVIISEVLNTTGPTQQGAQAENLPQGNMSGHAVSVGSGYSGSYYCEEHGFIIGIMSVMPLPAYQQGIEKHYLRKDPLDYYYPSFAHIGEQPVQNKELYAFTDQGDQTFGYIPRFSEYKYMRNRIAGEFRNSLDAWHLGRIFDNMPTLSQEFLEVDDENLNRIFAVDPNQSDPLYCQIVHKIKAVRPMPMYGTPMI